MAGHETVDKLSLRHVNKFRKNILGWYDENRRVLPWRALPGRKTDPYQVWLSEIMLQQTVVAAVVPYFIKFMKSWPTVFDLAAAPQDDVMAAWAGLGYYTRARNLYKCAGQIVEQHNGIFPQELKVLKALPGIGDYTSAAIRSIAFDLPATVVDGNVERVISRYFAIETPLPDSKPLIKKYAGILSESRTDHPGDFAQGMMDLGATVCTPQSPSCHSCPVRKACRGYEQDLATDLPRRKARKAKPQKIGHVYWLTDKKGRVLCERRPEKGMLGGMIGFPTSEWIVKQGRQKPDHLDFVKDSKPKVVKDMKVLHSFTHFDLELKGYVAEIESKTAFHKRYVWVDPDQLDEAGLPTLFKKFAALANMV